MTTTYTFECKICYSPYNDTDKVPLVLPCGHTYCKECIKTLYINRRVKCPNKKKNFELFMYHHHLNFSPIIFSSVSSLNTNKFFL